MDAYDAKVVYSFDPRHPEDCAITIGEIANFINAERAASGLPSAKTILILGTDASYD